MDKRYRKFECVVEAERRPCTDISGLPVKPVYVILCFSNNNKWKVDGDISFVIEEAEPHTSAYDRSSVLAYLTSRQGLSLEWLYFNKVFHNMSVRDQFKLCVNVNWP